MVAVRDLIGFLGRNAKIIALSIAAMFALALFYLGTTRPQFTGVATVFVDTPRIQVLQDDVGASMTRDNPTLESHAEVLRSDKIALMVIRQEKLLQDPEFSGTSKGWRTQIAEIFTGPAPPTVLTPIDLFNVFRNRLLVKRIGQSFVIEVSFRSSDRVKAARLANAVTTAYIGELLGAKTNAARVGAEWLEERVTELRKQTTAAASAVQEFKTRPDIVDQRRAQLQLAELESAAESYKTIYTAYLQKLTETVQQQSVPLTEARVLNEAVTPNEPSHPKSKLILALAGLLGLIGGIALSILRQSFRRSFTTSAELSSLGLDILGRMPNGAARASGVRRLGTLYDAFSVPNSPFADGFRNIKTLLDLGRPANYRSTSIGVISAAPLEGRSTLAFNLAVTLARSGRRTALVDVDAAHAGSITQSLVPASVRGLINVVAGEIALCDLAVPLYAGCHLIPVGPRSGAGEISDFFISEKALSSFRDLSSQYDAVIVDLPPPTRMDPRATLACLDGYILVAQPNRAPIEAIRELASSLELAHAGVLGVVINEGGRIRRSRQIWQLGSVATLLLYRKAKMHLSRLHLAAQP